MQLNDFITPEMIAIFISASLTIVSAIAAYGVGIVKMYLQSKTSAAQWNFMKSQAATAVKWLEQSPAWSAEEGARKKQAAVLVLMSVAEKYKIPMTSELADKLIEEAVHDIKKTGYDFFDLDELALPAGA
jgi:hypothetical protein